MKDMQSVSVSVGTGGEPELLGVLLTQQRQRTRELCLWPASSGFRRLSEPLFPHRIWGKAGLSQLR